MTPLIYPRHAFAIALAGSTALAPSFSAAQAASDGGYADLVARLGPSLVTIEETGVADPFRDAPSAPERLTDDVEQGLDHLLGRPAPGEALADTGTGFVIDPEGLIVTNHRAVLGAQRIEVTLADGRSLEAQVIGTDPLTDIALLRVEASGLSPVTWADPAAVRVGDRLLALGDPAGPGASVTEGLVSARGRVADPARDGRYLLTDAVLDGRNSGGPLVDVQGRVIALADTWREVGPESRGLRAAVPADVVQGIVADLRDDGRVERGWLGVEIRPVAEAGASPGGEAAGAVVAVVQRGSPAAEAGIRPGDVILRVNDQTIRHVRDLTRTVASSAPGSQAEVTVLRDGLETVLTVTLGERSEQAT